MRNSKALSIKQKLTWSVRLTTLAALCLALAGFLGYEWATFEEEMVRDVQSIADVIGANSTAALSFLDPDAATETLSALKADVHIVEAAIYDANGEPFASYARADRSQDFMPPMLQPEGHRIVNRSLRMFRTIMMDGEEVGTIYIHTDLEEQEARWSAYLVIALMVILLSAGVAVLVGSRLQRGITTPLSELAQAAEAIAGGDLRARAHADSNDEIGVVARAFNGMTTSLRKLIGEVRHSTESVTVVADGLETNSQSMMTEFGRQEQALGEAGESVEQVVDSIKAVNRNAEQLADSANETTGSIVQMDVSVSEIANSMDSLSESIEGTSSSIVEMTQSIAEIAHSVEALRDATDSTTVAVHELNRSVEQVEGNASQSHELSDKTSQEAEEGMKAVSETMGGMREIRSRFEVLESIIASLAERSGSIGEIVKVIGGIAEQTNLLSLNAAIIASQAGEHGKPFAVVAEQVKNLADKTALSTREITGLIESVQDETNNAVDAMRAGSVTVQRGVSLSERAGQLLSEIADSSRVSAQMVSEIVAANKQQTRDIKQVDDAMAQVKQIVGHINASIREQDRARSEINRAVESIRALGHEVKRSTSEQSRESKLITNAVESVTNMIHQIASAMQAQTRGAEQIQRALDVFREIKGESTGRVEEFKGMVSTLSERSHKLEQEIGRFRTES